MIQANVHQAKSQLSKLIERAEAGEEVVIARNGKPVVRLTSMVDAPRKERRDLVGCMKGVRLPSDDAWRRMDEEIASDMLGHAAAATS